MTKQNPKDHTHDAVVYCEICGKAGGNLYPVGGKSIRAHRRCWFRKKEDGNDDKTKNSELTLEAE